MPGPHRVQRDLDIGSGRGVTGERKHGVSGRLVIGVAVAVEWADDEVTGAHQRCEADCDLVTVLGEPAVGQLPAVHRHRRGDAQSVEGTEQLGVAEIGEVGIRAGCLAIAQRHDQHRRTTLAGFGNQPADAQRLVIWVGRQHHQPGMPAGGEGLHAPHDIVRPAGCQPCAPGGPPAAIASASGPAGTGIGVSPAFHPSTGPATDTAGRHVITALAAGECQDRAMSSDHERPQSDTLHTLHLLDTPADASYNRIVQIATRLLGTPIAMVTLTDGDRQWCKASVGIDFSEISRDAFCNHASIEPGDAPFVVHDARSDPRLKNNPLVTGAPEFRFCAGQPLRAPGGERVGTLCVIDHQLHAWTDADQEVLRELAALLEHLISQEQLSDVSSKLQRSETREALMLETIHDGLAIVDAHGRIVQWNPAAEQVLGLTSDEISGRTSFDPRWAAIHRDGTPWPDDRHPSMEAISTGKPVRDVVMGVHRPRASLVWLRVNSTPFVEPDGSISGALTSFADITRIIEAEQAPRGGTADPQPARPPAYDHRLLERATHRFAESLTSAKATLDREGVVAHQILDDLRDGVPFTVTIERIQMGAEHESLTNAIADLEAARRGIRIHMFRALLAEGYSIGEIARTWGVSRQLASRILRDAKDVD